MIRTKGLGRRFGDRWAVRDLTFEVRAGEVFGFLGPNGAGKTTSVRMLSGLIAPTTGAAWVAGAVVGSENRLIRRRVGLLTESPGLYEKLSAAANLEFYAHLYDLPAADRRRQIERYLKMFGLWEFRDEPVAGFSKGMKQKLALARAVLHEPSVLFLDEPTAGLDPSSTRLVRDLISELRAAGRTILLCTHNLDEARRLCDRVAIVRQTILRVDSPEVLAREVAGQRVEIRLADQSPRFLEVTELPAVHDASYKNGHLLVTVGDVDRDTPAVVRWLVMAGAEVQRVSVAEGSLEDAYLEIVDGRPVPQWEDA